MTSLVLYLDDRAVDKKFLDNSRQIGRHWYVANNTYELSHRLFYVYKRVKHQHDLEQIPECKIRGFAERTFGVNLLEVYVESIKDEILKELVKQKNYWPTF